jgi:hypothetical protein
LYVDRKWVWDRENPGAEGHQWTFSQTHSSGGRDTDQEPSDPRAERNFAAAIIALADLADRLMTPETLAQLETAYQAQRAENRAEAEAAAAAKQAAIDADPALGLTRAAGIIAELRAEAKVSPVGRAVRPLFERGADPAVPSENPAVVATETRGGQVRFAWVSGRGASERPVKAGDLPAMIAATSARGA